MPWGTVTYSIMSCYIDLKISVGLFIHFCSGTLLWLEVIWCTIINMSKLFGLGRPLHSPLYSSRCAPRRFSQRKCRTKSTGTHVTLIRQPNRGTTRNNIQHNCIDSFLLFLFSFLPMLRPPVPHRCCLWLQTCPTLVCLIRWFPMSLQIEQVFCCRMHATFWQDLKHYFGRCSQRLLLEGTHFRLLCCKLIEELWLATFDVIGFCSDDLSNDSGIFWKHEIRSLPFFQG